MIVVLSHIIKMGCTNSQNNQPKYYIADLREIYSICKNYEKMLKYTNVSCSIKLSGSCNVVGLCEYNVHERNYLVNTKNYIYYRTNEFFKVHNVLIAHELKRKNNYDGAKIKISFDAWEQYLDIYREYTFLYQKYRYIHLSPKDGYTKMTDPITNEFIKVQKISYIRQPIEDDKPPDYEEN